jgi:HSP20 family protein
MQHFPWNSSRVLADAERRFSALVDNCLRQEPRQRNGHPSWTPAVDVSESAEAFVFTVELPGIKPDAMMIEVKDNTLTIKGEQQSAEPKDGVRIHHRERPRGCFARTFRLHKPVDAGKVSATYRDGLLEVSVPLRLEAQPRKIPVRGS